MVRRAVDNGIDIVALQQLAEVAILRGSCMIKGSSKPLQPPAEPGRTGSHISRTPIQRPPGAEESAFWLTKHGRDRNKAKCERQWRTLSFDF